MAPESDDLRERVRFLEQRVADLEARVRQTWTRRVRRRLVRMLGPNLGILRQHGPRPLRVPRHYSRSLPPDPAPTLSIVTTSKNQAAFLPRAIESVLMQGYPALQYLVQDGASTDGSTAILAKYERRLRWISEPDASHPQALNRGLSRTTGEIMAWLNSDDRLLPGTLSYVASYFAAHPEVDVVYGHRIVIDEDDREIGRWVLPPHDAEVLSWGDYVPQETLFWRRRLWDRIGGAIDESFLFAFDWDLLLRFRDASAVFVRLPRFLGAFRIHGMQKTAWMMPVAGHEDTRRLQQRCHGRALRGDEVADGLDRYFSRALFLGFLYRLGLLRH
jgi:glycosyltransferase involved in cell wall biosynthesis